MQICVDLVICSVFRTVVARGTNGILVHDIRRSLRFMDLE